MSVDTPALEEAGSIRAAPIPEVLSFEWMHGRVNSYVRQAEGSGPSGAERGATWLALGSAGVGLLAAGISPYLLAPPIALTVMVVALTGEVLGFSVSVALMLWRVVPQWRRLRANHAEEMDKDFKLWRVLVAEMRSFPRDRREQLLSFARRLREGMTFRLGLAFGGVERLGIFPVLVALYFQFRNWKFGDWRSAFDVHLVGGLLIWAIALLYVMGWALVGLRGRLCTYIDLLEESIED